MKIPPEQQQLRTWEQVRARLLLNMPLERCMAADEKLNAETNSYHKGRFHMCEEFLLHMGEELNGTGESFGKRGYRLLHKGGNPLVHVEHPDGKIDEVMFWNLGTYLLQLIGPKPTPIEWVEL